jgi:spermidine synthase
MDSIDKDEYINTDFEPRMMNIVFGEWFAKYGSSPRSFFIAVMIIIFLYIIFMKKEEYVLFSSGMAAMGVEILIIYSFQIMYGYVYLKIGIIVTVFLLGLLPGAVIGSMYIQKRDAELIFSEFVLILLLIAYYIWVSFIKSDLHQGWFMLYGFLFSFFCGFQFPIVTGIIGEKTSPAAGCIAADLAGAAVGTLIVGTLLVPLTGIHSAIILIILIKLISCLFVMFRRRGRV